MMISNLDIQCARYGQELANIEDMSEKVINAALAVLEEQGPYAMFLYIMAREKKISDKFCEICAHLFRATFPQSQRSPTKQTILEWMGKVAENLDDLLFIKEILVMTLAYSRYHLKAKTESDMKIA